MPRSKQSRHHYNIEVRTLNGRLHSLYMRFRRGDALVNLAFFVLSIAVTTAFSYNGPIIVRLLVGLLEFLGLALIFGWMYIVLIAIAGIDLNSFSHPSSKPHRSKYQPITLKSESVRRTAVGDKARL